MGGRKGPVKILGRLFDDTPHDELVVSDQDDGEEEPHDGDADSEEREEEEEDTDEDKDDENGEDGGSIPRKWYRV